MRDFQQDILFFTNPKNNDAGNYWSTKAVSDGHSINQSINILTNKFGLIVQPDETSIQPYITLNTITLPPLTHFKHYSNLQHALNHELSHYFCRYLNNDTKERRISALLFEEATGNKINIQSHLDGVMAEGLDYFSGDKLLTMKTNLAFSDNDFKNIVKNSVLLFTKEELVCEVNAMNMLRHMKIKPSDNDIAYSCATCKDLETIQNCFGFSLRKENHGIIDTMSKVYVAFTSEYNMAKSKIIDQDVVKKFLKKDREIGD